MNLILNENDYDKNTILCKIASESIEFIKKEVIKSNQLNCLSNFSNENQTNNYYDLIKIANYIEKNPGHKFKTVENKYRKCTSIGLFYKIKKFVKNDYKGFNKLKINLIKEQLFKKFIEKRSTYSKISDKLLQIWSLKLARSLNLKNFRAEQTFINNFKIKFGISGRKVTKLVQKPNEKKLK